MWLSNFPEPFIDEMVLSPLYVLGFFVVNQLAIYVSIYFCARDSVPLIYVSVFYTHTMLTEFFLPTFMVPLSSSHALYTISPHRHFP